MPDISPDDAIKRVRAIFGDTVSVKPIHNEADKRESDEGDITDLLTKVCYFYPQYNLETVELLTDSQVMALLLQAEKQRAIEFYNQALIAAAPHTKKGALFTKIVEEYKKITEL